MRKTNTTCVIDLRRESFDIFIQGVLSLTFGEDAAKPNKDKDAMYSARPEIEVLLLLLRYAFSQLTPEFARTLKILE